MNSPLETLQKALSSRNFGLEDSGDGERLERFGDKLIRRPSSLAIWKRNKAATVWDSADATFDPDRGWRYRNQHFNEWPLKLGPLVVTLMTQENGQIGIFPEHVHYFSDITNEIARLQEKRKQPLKVLNLFAYTGLATAWCALHQAEVTHIELSKRVLTWAKENLEKTGTFTQPIRFIPEDACLYLERESRRGSRYDLIISDPPSFSRISKSQSWNLDDVIAPHISALNQVLSPGGVIFLTSHHSALSCFTLENLFRDLPGTNAQYTFSQRNLVLTEQERGNSLTCGSLLIARNEAPAITQEL